MFSREQLKVSNESIDPRWLSEWSRNGARETSEPERSWITRVRHFLGRISPASSGRSWTSSRVGGISDGASAGTVFQTWGIGELHDLGIPRLSLPSRALALTWAEPRLASIPIARAWGAFLGVGV